MAVGQFPPALATAEAPRPSYGKQTSVAMPWWSFSPRPLLWPDGRVLAFLRVTNRALALTMALVPTKPG